MQIQDLLEAANSIDEKVSEKDVVDYYKGNNFGYWPSETSKATLSTEGGEITLSTDPGVISANHDITPAGKKWLLGHFFQQSVSQSITDMKRLNNDNNVESISLEVFHNRIVKRMAGISKFVRTGSTLLAFSERKRVNLDKSKLYSYDIVNMDKDMLSKHALMIPSAKPVIYVFEYYKKQVVRSRMSVNGRFFEGLAPWERAEYIAMTPVDIFDVQPVSEAYLEEVFSLTERADEITNKKLQEKLKEMFSQGVASQASAE